MTFNKDLSFAHSIEAWFLATYPDLFAASTDLKYDLVYVPTGQLVEVKAERRPATTPNLFIETVANDNKNTPGGPLRALQDKVDLFIYIHEPCKTFYVFNTAELHNRVQSIIEIHKPKQHRIWNRTYNTLGYAIKKDLLLDLCIDILST